MKIVCISDTHIPARAEGLPRPVTDALERADLVLHAGDLTDMETLEYLEGLPRFVGAAGNMDVPQVRRRLRDLEIVEHEGVRIALIHGWGAPGPLPGVLRLHLESERPSAIVYGHSHRPHNERVDGVLMFNPGSPTDRVFAPYRSYGVLRVEEGSVTGEIVRLPGEP
jgi:putative phosphoesterase